MQSNDQIQLGAPVPAPRFAESGGTIRAQCFDLGADRAGLH